MLPIRKNSAANDQRFIEYVRALTDGVTGRIIDLLRRAAVGALGHGVLFSGNWLGAIVILFIAHLAARAFSALIF